MAYLVVILKNKSMKSFYYPIHENFPLEINLLYGIDQVFVLWLHFWSVRGVGDNNYIFLHVLQVNALLYDKKENSLDSEYLASIL